VYNDQKVDPLSRSLEPAVFHPCKSLLTLLLAFLLSSAVGAQAPGDKKDGKKEDNKAIARKFAEWQRLMSEARKLRQQGKLDAALKPAEALVSLGRELTGKDGIGVLISLEWLAGLQEERGDFPAARKARQEVLDINTRANGSGDWRTTDARLALAHTELLTRLKPEQRKQLDKAIDMGNEAYDLMQRGKYREALALAQKALAIRIELLGRSDRLYALSLNNLGAIYQKMGDPIQAAFLWRRGLAVTKNLLGSQHPQHAALLINLGQWYKEQGDFQQADNLFKEAAGIIEKTSGKVSHDQATLLNNQGEMYRFQGDLARAEAALTQALAICTKIEHQNTPLFASILNNLALVDHARGNLTRAEKYFRSSLKVIAAVQGKKAPNYLATQQNLAVLYDDLADTKENAEDFKAAQQARRAALELWLELYGKTHWRAAAARRALARTELLGNLGPVEIRRLKEATRQLDEAGKLSTARQHSQALVAGQQAREAYRQILGEKDGRSIAVTSRLAGLYFDAGDLIQAEMLLRHVLALRREVFGEAHPDTRDTLRYLAHVLEKRAQEYLNQQDFLAAARVRREVVAVQTQLHGDKSAPVIDARWDVVYAERMARLTPQQRQHLSRLMRAYPRVGELVQQGNYKPAIQLAREASDTLEKHMGKDHPLHLEALNFLGKTYQQAGDLKRAEVAFRKAVTIGRESLGEAHPDHARSLTMLAEVSMREGKADQADDLLQRALRVHEATGKVDDLDHARCLRDLGKLLLERGDLTRSEALLRQAMQITAEVTRRKGDEWAGALDDLGMVYQQKGVYGLAELLWQQSLAIYKANKKKAPWEYARALGRLAALAAIHRSDLPGADELLRDALASIKGQGKDDHPVRLELVHIQARIQDLAGRYGPAEKSFRKLLASLPEDGTPDQMALRASVLNNLAMLYLHTGDYEQADDCARKSAQLWKQALGEKHPRYALSLNNRAELYRALGDNKRALPLYQEAAAIWRETLGEEHPYFANCQNNLGLLYLDHENYEQAERFLRRAMEIRLEVLGDEHPDYAQSLQNLGGLYQVRGELARAREFHLRTLRLQKRLLGDEHPTVAGSLHNLGVVDLRLGKQTEAERNLNQALAIFRRILGENHPTTARCRHYLALLYAETKRPERARETLLLNLKNEHAQIRQVLGFSAEETAGAYRGTLKPNLDLLVRLTAARQSDAGEVSIALMWVMRQKGILLDALCRLRDTQRYLEGDPATLVRVQHWRALRQRLVDAVLKPSSDVDTATLNRRLAALREEAATLEADLHRTLAKRFPDPRDVMVTVKRVRAQLPPEAALVEIIRVRMLAGKSGDQPDHYFAFVLLASEDTPVRLIDLGSAEAIDRAVADVRARLERVPDELGRKLSSEATLEKEYQGSAQALHQLVFAPLEKLLGRSSLIYLAPDSELNRVAFEALVDDRGKYLIERFHFSYLASGRDLLRPVVKPARGTVVFAGPDFDLAAPKRKRLADALPGQPEFLRGTSPDVRGLRWRALPGAAREAADVEELLKGSVYAPVKRYEGEQALEEALKRLAAPRILHLATHGFFLEDPRQDPSRRDDLARPLRTNASGLARLSRQANPLLRSGLVLAGANRLGDKGAVEGVEDGWVTAEEIALLNLRGCELVVLSACETGRGDVHTGEGVFGLRRAFLYAGARTLLSSLYPVPDAETRHLMRSFYAALEAGKNKREALRSAQLEAIQRRRKEHRAAHPFFWASFVLVGDGR
jgi:CHAT domain-containing protein/Tfp pilus assembly protein PilF